MIKFKGNYFLALISGFLILFSLPPYNLGFLAWVAFVPVLLSIRLAANNKESFFLALFTAIPPISGIAFSLIPFNFHFYFLLLFFLPLFFGILGVTYKKIMERNGDSFFIRIFIVPSVWTMAEFFLTESPLSLPLNLAISQASYPIVIQIASLGGIYLVSFALLFVNALLCEVVFDLLSKRRENSFRPGILASVFLFLLMVYGFAELKSSHSYIPSRKIRVAMIQPVVASEDYRDHWIDPDVRRRLKEKFYNLTKSALIKSDANLLIWPEGGNGYYNFRLPFMRKQFRDWAIQYHVNLLVSSLDLDEDGQKFNSVFSVNSNGLLLDEYKKVKLTPIGEESFTPGKSLHPVKTEFGLAGILVCFESAFSSLARNLRNQGARFILITSSDAPFKNSTLPLLHSSMAIFRAVENRIPVIRSANTGPSMVIDPWGRVLARTSFYKEEILVSELALFENQKTLYLRFGFIWLGFPGLFSIWVVGSFFNKVPEKVGRFCSSFRLKPILFPALSSLFFIFIIPVFSLFAISVSHNSMGLQKSISFFLNSKKIISYHDRFDEFAQRGLVDCGPAALAYILNYFGFDQSQQKITSQIAMTEKGTSMAELAWHVRNLGFEAIGERGNVSRLIEVAKPLIAFISSNHFIVVLDAQEKWITFYDPAKPESIHKIEVQNFNSIWNGEVLRILPRSLNISEEL